MIITICCIIYFINKNIKTFNESAYEIVETTIMEEKSNLISKERMNAINEEETTVISKEKTDAYNAKVANVISEKVNEKVEKDSIKKEISEKTQTTKKYVQSKPKQTPKKPLPQSEPKKTLKKPPEKNSPMQIRFDKRLNNLDKVCSEIGVKKTNLTKLVFRYQFFYEYNTGVCVIAKVKVQKGFKGCIGKESFTVA